MTLPSTGLAARLIAGTSALGITIVMWSLLQIVAVRVFLLNWGAERYADWLTLNAATGLLSLLELGINAHLGARMMAAAGRDDTSDVDRTLATGLALYTVIVAAGTLLVAGVWWLGAEDLWQIATPDTGPAGLVLAAAALLLIPRPILGSVLSAFGRFPLATYLGGAQQILGLGAQLSVALAGGGLLAAAVAYLVVVLVIGWALPVVLIRRHHPTIALRARWPGWSELKQILFRSGLHAVAGATTPLLLNLPVLLLRRLLPDGADLVLFTATRTYAGTVRQIASQLVLSSAMEMTRQHHRGESAGLLQLFALAGRFTAGSMGLLAGLLLVAGGPIFQIWTHHSLSFDPWLAAIFLATATLSAPGLLGSALLRLTDHADTLLLASILQTGLSLLLCLVLIPTSGALGAGIAVGIAELVCVGGLGLWRARGLFKIGVMELWPSLAAGAAAFLLAGTLAIGTFQLLHPDDLPSLVLAGLVWTLPTLPALLAILLPQPRRRQFLDGLRRSMRIRF